ncbi:MAG: large subunit ribosomal protein L10 [Microgenomates group bacterium Gr01-1014_5]|nr:MAG: large subunit ribosomal protein L10 [Microgenomates group bacterium Gr01-1014_5]
MKKSDKPLIVDSLANQIKEAKSVTVLNYQGMPNKQLNELRQKVREAGGIFAVSKNTLIKRALEKVHDTLNSLNILDTLLVGPTAIILSQKDEVAPLQVLGKSIDESGLPKLKFGIFDGDVLGLEKLLTLSHLPGKNVLAAQLLGALIAPKYNMVEVLNGNLRKLVYILDQKAKAVN